MVKSRVLLDVTDSEINVGSNKTVWMYFPAATTKNICDLKKLIIQRFNLSKTNFNLSLNGGMLLDDEDIRILEKGDIIKLHYEEKENKSSDDQAASAQVSKSITKFVGVQHEDNEESDENTSEDTAIYWMSEPDPEIKKSICKKRKPYTSTRLSKKTSTDNASISAAYAQFNNLVEFDELLQFDDLVKKYKDTKVQKPKHNLLWLSSFCNGAFVKDKVNSILEMFPHFTYDAILQDLLKTNSKESTIENILAERLIPLPQSSNDLGEGSSHQPMSSASSTYESELAPPNAKKSFSAFVMQETLKTLKGISATGLRISGPCVSFVKATSEKDSTLNADGVQPHTSIDEQGNDTGQPPYEEILKEVVFSLSGFINPRRSKIRDLALAMGAKYNEIWDSSCTHLVCAFVNTPKYIEAKRDKAKIVTADWIISCHGKRTLLPWKHFMLETWLFMEMPGNEEKVINHEEEETSEKEETDFGISEIKVHDTCAAKEVPNCHKYKDSIFQPAKPTMFLKTIQKEMKILKSSLPEGIIVKSFEERMDLYSAVIKGPKGTPYEDGLFFFDIQFPAAYPYVPPRCHYVSFCRKRINPNLYETGKVCVSLLGTWSGEGSELWSYKTSNLLQVLVSIQGLILVSEPYYNEPGYECQRGTPRGIEGSRHYNQMVVENQVEAMSRLLSNPPELFKEEIREHFKENSSKIIERLEAWLAIAETEEMPNFFLSTSSKTSKKHKFAHSKKKENLSPSTSKASKTLSPPSTSKASKTLSPPSTSKASKTLSKSGENTSDNIHMPEFPLFPAGYGFRTSLKKFLTSFKSFLSSCSSKETLSLPASNFFKKEFVFSPHL